MDAPPSGPGPAPVWAMVRTLLPLDLAVVLGCGILWWITGLAQAHVIALLYLLRLPVWIGYGRKVLAPASAYVDLDGRCSDEQLLAVDAAMQGFGRRVSRVYVLSWWSVVMIWLGLGWSSAFAPSYASAELLTALMFSAAMLGLSSLVRMLLDSCARPLRIEISMALIERGLDAPRPQRSIVRPLTDTAMQMLLGAVLALGGIGLLWSAAGQREAAVERQWRRVQISAVYVAEGLGPALPGVRLVEGEAAGEAACVATKLGPELVAVFDVECGLAVAAAPVGDGRWAVSTEIADEGLWLFGLMLFVVAAAAVPSFTMGFMVFAKTITAPLERFGELAHRFVEDGELRTLQRFVPLYDDELGKLATGFNDMLDMLEELAATAEAVAEGDLTVRIDHPGELHEAFRGMVMRLGEAAWRMRETALELGGAAQEITALMHEQSEAAREQSTSVKRLSATVDSLASSAQDIALAAVDVRRDAERSLETTRVASEQLEQLRDHAHSVTQLLELIHEIADRSDLLALNGALEATRAGDAGRGFALVAAEMRRLAERVTGTVGDVRGRVVEIERSGTSTVAATENSRALVQRTAEAAREISTITATQSEDTQQASARVRAFAEVVMRGAVVVSQTRAAAAGLGEHAADLERLMSRFKLHDGPDFDDE